MKNTDLHTHTYYSDGLYSPKKLLTFSKNKNIKNLAITDHDSIDGLIEAKKYNKDIGVNLINGVEIFSYNTEILGYFFDTNNSELLSLLDLQKTQKEKFIIKAIDNLQDMNLDIEYEEVLDIAYPSKILTTTHIARILIDKGYGEDMQTIYNKYFKKFKVHLEIPPIQTKKVIKTINNSSGVSVLPHPWYLKNHIKDDIYKFLSKLKKYGLSGIETTGYIPDELKTYQEIDFIKNIKEISKRLDLVETGGSDFHGEKIHPDNILGKYNIDKKIIKQLKSKI